MDFGLVIGGVGRCGKNKNFHMAHLWVVLLGITRMDRWRKRDIMWMGKKKERRSIITRMDR